MVPAERSILPRCWVTIGISGGIGESNQAKTRRLTRRSLERPPVLTASGLRRDGAENLCCVADDLEIPADFGGNP